MSRHTIQSDKAEQIRQFNFTDIQILTGKRRKKKKKRKLEQEFHYGCTQILTSKH